MFKWVQSGLSAVAGTAEPEYGREAIHPVTDTVQGKQPYRETIATDFEWNNPNYTNVETQTFYFNCAQTGYQGLIQVIHSNVMGLNITAQFTFKIYHKDSPTDFTWTSTKLEDFVISGTNFYAQNLSIVMTDNNEYHIRSSVTADSVVDMKITRICPGVIFGENGTTYYGTDKAAPWGSMRHAFWPRASAEGTVKLGEQETITISGLSMYSMALQGMKPHHAAATWNFLDFQSENYSAILMEFTTPISYAKTKVAMGVIVKNDKIVSASIDNETVHTKAEIDAVGWPAPSAIEFNFDGYAAEATNEQIAAGKATKVVAKVSGDLDTLIERVDVMAEVPQFVKSIVSGVAGTKPYIYQFSNKMTIEVDVNGNVDKEEGIAFNEATFISGQ
ncbi:hypothetical protein BABINDRAFT_170712 [Babjeviella inositovora NRRL Y-12698]|uniref:Survival factor 1 n=1 Tax=Babjeviella inositovora NRRL Y-12698 TaxID=984486 RepID=A0A1E3QTW9_9ASCO|nr:uncharacterized protein BABINDRAFT_170712 [Babjeviella inositovora NRRL Y-12698]ODQ81004.1 hypothetical protein BABINDRAFT_170712 [Babjeviella inositovora NRRL Y-12698]